MASIIWSAVFRRALQRAILARLRRRPALRPQNQLGLGISVAENNCVPRAVELAAGTFAKILTNLEQRVVHDLVHGFEERRPAAIGSDGIFDPPASRWRGHSQCGFSCGLGQRVLPFGCLELRNGPSRAFRTVARYPAQQRFLCRGRTAGFQGRRRNPAGRIVFSGESRRFARPWGINRRSASRRRSMQYASQPHHFVQNPLRHFAFAHFRKRKVTAIARDTAEGAGSDHDTTRHAFLSRWAVTCASENEQKRSAQRILDEVVRLAKRIAWNRRLEALRRLIPMGRANLRDSPEKTIRPAGFLRRPWNPCMF